MANIIITPREEDRVEWFDESTGTWRLLNYQWYTTRSARVEIPDTRKRFKPQDLFANSTQRTVTRYDEWAPNIAFRLRQWDYKGPSSCLYALGDQGRSQDFSFDSVDQRLRAKVKSQTSNVLQTIAELNQTVSMASNFAKDIRLAFKALKPGYAFANIVGSLIDESRSGKRKKILANRWLEVQYGWRPALQDLYGAADSLNRKITEGFPQYVQAGDRFTFEESTNRTRSFDGSSYDYVRSFSQEARLLGKARFTVRSTVSKTMSELGITNPALLVWELLPYSFVIDQVLPIGNWLSSLDALVGVENLVVNRSYLNTEVNTEFGSFGASIYKKTQKVRLGSTSDLAIGWPHPKPTSNMLSLVNDLALLVQLRKTLP